MDEVAGCPECRLRPARVAELGGTVRDLAARVKDLTARLQDKQPPSRPASGLPAGPGKKPTGRKPGGQPGHPPHLKQLLLPERVATTIPYVPTTCAQCPAGLPAAAGPANPAPTCHQVVELPAVAVTVTELQGNARTRPGCGQVTRAAVPATLRAHSVGPGLTGVIGYLAGGEGISKRGVEEIVETVFGAPVALRSVANRGQGLTAALAPVHTAATEGVRAAPVRHVGETGRKQAGQKRWLWVAATQALAVLVIRPWRGLAALESLLGPRLRGILCSDRWVVYDPRPEPSARQVCWATPFERNRSPAGPGGSSAVFGLSCRSSAPSAGPK